jgi:hypothetical protein
MSSFAPIVVTMILSRLRAINVDDPKTLKAKNDASRPGFDATPTIGTLETARFIMRAIANG